MKPAILALAAALLLPLAQGVAADEFEVRMLNKGEKGAMVFEPDLVRAEVGDTIRFVPTDKGHNAETIKGMVPAGFAMVVGKMNEEVTLTVTEQGIYGVRCKPHYGMGMVAVVVAGEPVNLENARTIKAPGKAGKRLMEILAEVGK